MAPGTPPARPVRPKPALLDKRNRSRTAKQRNRGGRGNCAVCKHEQRAQIDSDLVAGRPFRELVKRYGMSLAALSRHKANHVSEALASLTKSKAAPAVSFDERMEALIATTHQLLAAAIKGKNGAQALMAVRELGRLTEVWGRANGQLNDRPTTVVNVQATQEWVQLRSVVVEFVPPERRKEFSQRLQVLEGANSV